MNKLLKIYAVLTTLGMFLIVLMGAIVTKTDSGEGCGNSWPLCYGEILPSQPKLETMIEYSHRVVSALLGLMVIILAIWTWRKLKSVRETKLLAFLSVFLIVFQGLLGAAAVIWGQSSFVLALHFGISLLSLASVFLLTLLIFEKERYGRAFTPAIPKQWRKQIYALSVYIYIVVYTGALVRHTKSSLACSAWPICNNNEWIPSLTSHAGIQFIHRIAAGLIFIWLLWLFIKSLRANLHRVIALSFKWSLAFVAFQVISGAAAVLSRLNLFIALAHGFFIACLFCILSYLLMLAVRSGSLEK
ncbi:COX15/CtaA family protein [Bacillus taeanensis]|uniref:COX15/CtaA family protein n=1 Tax=Bacillus taeanensis TaxID=273032 RepID=UPI0015F0ABFA|nr:heme A synthase [Bacillus taeanensis]